eukprot:5641213-Amphidinium_carterae.2
MLQQDLENLQCVMYMDKCNPTTPPGDKKPPIAAAQPLDKEQHSNFKVPDSSGTTIIGLTIEG